MLMRRSKAYPYKPRETHIHRNASTLPAALIRNRLEFVELVAAPHEPGRTNGA